MLIETSFGLHAYQIGEVHISDFGPLLKVYLKFQSFFNFIYFEQDFKCTLLKQHNPWLKLHILQILGKCFLKSSNYKEVTKQDTREILIIKFLAKIKRCLIKCFTDPPPAPSPSFFFWLRIYTVCPMKQYFAQFINLLLSFHSISRI